MMESLPNGGGRTDSLTETLSSNSNATGSRPRFPSVRVTEPTSYMHELERSPVSHPLLKRHTVPHLVSSPILTPPSDYSSGTPSPELPFSLPSPYASSPDEGDIEVSEYELEQAKIRKHKQMQERVLHLHKMIGAPLPKPLTKIPLDRVNPDSLQLTVQVAQSMLNMIDIQHRGIISGVEYEGPSAKAYARAILENHRLAELRREVGVLSTYFGIYADKRAMSFVSLPSPGGSPSPVVPKPRAPSSTTMTSDWSSSDSSSSTSTSPSTSPRMPSPPPENDGSGSDGRSETSNPWSSSDTSTGDFMSGESNAYQMERVHQLEQEISEDKDELDELNERLRQAQRELLLWNHRNTGQDSKIDELKREVTQTRTFIKIKEAQIAELEKERDELRQANQSLQESEQRARIGQQKAEQRLQQGQKKFHQQLDLACQQADRTQRELQQSMKVIQHSLEESEQQRVQLEQALSVKENAIEEATNEVRRLKSELEETGLRLETEKDELAMNLQIASRRLETSAKTAEQLQGQIDALTAIEKELLEQLEQIKTKNSELTEALALAEEGFSVEQEKALEQSEQKEKAIQRLEQLEILNAQQVESGQKMQRRLESTLEELKNETQAVDLLQVSLREEKEKADKSQKSLKKSVKKLKAQIEEITGQRDAKQQELKTTAEELRKWLQRNEELRDEWQTSRKRVQELEQELILAMHNFKKEKAEAEQEHSQKLEEQQLRIQELESELLSLRESNRVQTEILAKSENEAKSWQAQQKLLERQVAKVTLEWDQGKKEVEKAKCAAILQQVEKEREFSEKLQQLEKDNTSVNLQLTDLKQQEQQSRRKCQEAEKQLELKRGELRELEEDRDHHKHQTETTELEKQTLKEELGQQIDQLRKQLEKSQGEVQEAAKNRELAETRAEESEQELQRLTQQFEDQSTELKTIKAQLSTVQRDFEQDDIKNREQEDEIQILTLELQSRKERHAVELQDVRDELTLEKSKEQQRSEELQRKEELISKLTSEVQKTQQQLADTKRHLERQVHEEKTLREQTEEQLKKTLLSVNGQKKELAALQQKVGELSQAELEARNLLQTAQSEVTSTKKQYEFMLKAWQQGSKELLQVKTELGNVQLALKSMANLELGDKEKAEKITEQLKKIQELTEQQNELAAEVKNKALAISKLELEVDNAKKEAENQRRLYEHQIRETNQAALLLRNQRFSLLEDEKHRLTADLDRLNKEVDKLKLEAKQTHNLYEEALKQKNEYEQELRTLKPENERLKKQVQELERRLADLEQTSKVEAEALRSQINELRGKLQESERQVRELSLKVSTAESEASTLKETNQSLHKQIEETLEETEQRVSAAENMQKAKEVELTQLQSQHQQLGYRAAELENELKLERSQVQTLTTELTEVNKELDAEKDMVEKQQDQIRQTVEQTVEKVQALETDLHQTKEAEREASSKVEEKEEQLKALQTEVSEYRNKLKEKTKALTESYQHNEELVHQLQVAEDFRTIKRPLVVQADDTVSQTSGYISNSKQDTDSQTTTGIYFPPELGAVIDNLKGFKIEVSDHLVASNNESLLQLGVHAAADTLGKRWREIEDKYRTYQYDRETPPCLTAKRQELIDAQMECRKRFLAIWEKYGNGKEISQQTSQALQERLTHVDDTIRKYELEKKKFDDARVRIDEQRFASTQRPDESLLLPGRAKPGYVVKMALVTLQRLQTGFEPDLMKDELNGYAAGAMVQSVCESLKSKFATELAMLHEPDDRMRHLLLYKKALVRLKPDMLPGVLAGDIPPSGRVFMDQMVKETEKSLDLALDPENHTPKSLSTEDLPGPRGVSGQEIVESMLDNPEFCLDMVSFLSSVKVADEMEVDYTRASQAWLRDMRIKYRLVDLPTFTELYQGCADDLQARHGSRLLAAYVSAHEGEFKTKKQESGRDKLGRFVQKCREEEFKLENSKDYWRGQAHNGKQLVVHPHRQVLDCFKPGTQCQLVDAARVREKGSSYTVSHLGVNRNALLNTFYQGVGKAVVSESRTAGVRHLKVEQVNCHPPLVFKEKKPSWQVSMANAIWTVDPCILLDNPELVVPFEDRKNQPPKQRDWIPVRDQNGNTGILVLRKTAAKYQYFLYEVSSSGKLVPRAISENPAEELHQARFLLAATQVKKDPDIDPISLKNAHPDVQMLVGSRREWVPSGCLAELQQAYEAAAEPVSHTCPIVTLNASILLDNQRVELNPLRRKLQHKRQDLHKPVTQQCDFNPQHFAHFAVEGTFELFGDAYLEARRKQLKNPQDPVLEGLAEDQDEFSQNAFRSLTVFVGCELDPGIPPGLPDETAIPGTPEYVIGKLDHVMKVNRNHCVRLTEQMDQLSQQVVDQVTASEPDAFLHFSSRQILDQVLAEFEQGNLPENCNNPEFVSLVSYLIMAENDRVQTERIIAGQIKLRQKLVRLSLDCSLMASDVDRQLYKKRCQEQNLQMALLATRQRSVHERLESYATQNFTTETMALMSFERRAKTVLRPNQVEEVVQSLEAITESMENNTPMARVSHKGTGWGKSTILQILTDHSSRLAGNRTDCSVLVVAPESNQAELDITLGNYYASKGRVYRRLNMDEFVRHGQWWTIENMHCIHNTLLGLPSDTPADCRAGELEKLGRAPVGASIKDIQILMQLHNGLLAKPELSPEESQIVEELDSILDMVRHSMTFCDEWSSAMIPSRKRDLDTIVTGVNSALEALEQTPVMTDQVIKCHDEFVMGCYRRQLLSATTATDCAGAVVTGTSHREDVKQRLHTDPLTTQQRFRHWLNQAEPLFTATLAGNNRKLLLREVVGKVGSKRPIMIFDGTEPGDNTAARAKRFYKDLQKVRAEHEGSDKPEETKGMLFYNKKKEVQKYLEGDPVYGRGHGHRVSSEEVSVLRDEGGASVDVYLTQEQSEGTDAPQGRDSVGVYFGLLEQGDVGREDYVAQQIGRLMRATTELRDPQKLFVVVDIEALKQCPDSPESQALKSAVKKLTEAKQKLLEKHCNGSLEHLPDQQQALVNTPLQVLVDDEDSPKPEESLSASLIRGNREKRLQKQVNDEIEQLRHAEWSRSNILGDFASDLGELKKLEWEAKKAWLKLSALELSRRESTKDTRHYETLLMQAQERSHLRSQYAEENQWLRSGGGGHCQTFTLSPQLAVRLGNERQRSLIQSSVRNASAEYLANAPRRVVPEQVDRTEFPKLLKPDFGKGQFESCANYLLANGIESPETDPLAEVRTDLYIWSKNAYELLATRVDEMIDIIVRPDGSGTVTINETNICNLHQLRQVKKSAQEMARGFNEVINGPLKSTRMLDKHALELEQHLQGMYAQMMDTLVSIGYDNKQVGVGLKTDAAKRLDAYVKKFLKQPEKPSGRKGAEKSEPELGISVEGTTVEQMKSRGVDMKFPRAPDKHSRAERSGLYVFCWKVGTKLARKGKVSLEFTNLLGPSPVSRGASVRITSSTASTRIPRSASVRGTRTDQLRRSHDPEKSREAFDRLIAQAALLQEEKEDDQKVKDFCQDVTNADFRQCVEEWLEYMQQPCREFYQTLKQGTEETSHVIGKQIDMMQSNTILVN